MLLKRHFEQLLLSPSDLEPLRDDFRGRWCFQSGRNPGRRRGDSDGASGRAAARKTPDRLALPRWSTDEGLEIDWVANDEIDVIDPRVVKRKADGLVRLTFISHLHVVHCGMGVQ